MFPLYLFRFAPKRLTLASDRKKNKSKAKLKREMSLQMLSDDLVQSDVLVSRYSCNPYSKLTSTVDSGIVVRFFDLS